MKIDETPPDRIPTKSAKEKSDSVGPPKISRQPIGRSVRIIVMIDRVSVSCTERLTISR